MTVLSILKARAFKLIGLHVLALSVLIGINTVPSCNTEQYDQFQVRQQALADDVRTGQAVLNETVAAKEQLKVELDAAQAVIDADPTLSAEEKAAQAEIIADTKVKIDEFGGKADDLLAAINAKIDQFNALSKEIAEAPNQAEAWAAGIRGGGNLIAPAAGPYDPLVRVGSYLLAALVSAVGTGFFAKRVGVAEGVRKVALPIENNRDEEAERLLAAQGKNVIVFDKVEVGTDHLLNGVAGAIESATSGLKVG